jgi:hypothetical protein
MRKSLIIAGCILTFALFNVASTHAAPTCSDALGALFTPAPISQASCIACSGSYTTSAGGGAASHWGFGSTCSAALTDLTNQTKAAANNYCLANVDDYLSCNFAVVITGGCAWTGSQYRYDGYANFSCKVWVVGPGCPRP